MGVEQCVSPESPLMIGCEFSNAVSLNWSSGKQQGAFLTMRQKRQSAGTLSRRRQRVSREGQRTREKVALGEEGLGRGGGRRRGRRRGGTRGRRGARRSRHRRGRCA